MLVWNIVDNTVAMAAKVLRGIYPNDEVNVNTVYHMVFQPVFSVFGQNSGDEKQSRRQITADRFIQQNI